MRRCGSLALPWVVLALVGPAAGTAQDRMTRAVPLAAAPIAAPPSLTAVSTVPTQIVLNWPAVTGAEGYRVTRTSSVGEPETTVYEGRTASFALDRGMCAGGRSCWYPNNNVGLKPLYSYRVYSVFPGPVYSEPGPVASARSAPFLAPANLTHAVVPSTIKPGQFQVTVSWLPVPGADAYQVAPKTGGIAPTTVRTASVRFDPLRPGTTYGLCVSSIYPPNIRDDSVTSCITLVL